MSVKCKICGNDSSPIFTAEVRWKYRVSYYQCGLCDFVQTEAPYWLEEAYREVINKEDTMILSRSIAARRHLSVVLYFLFSRTGKYLDYAGGLGILVRLMRDAGYDFYWQDKHAQNLFARGFDYDACARYEAVTSFECFEHFVDPLSEIEKLFTFSDTIIFTTCLLPEGRLTPDWSYLGLSHGQHISFYSAKTVQWLAQRLGANYHSIMGLQIITRKRLSRCKFSLLKALCRSEILCAGLYYYLRRRLTTKMGPDSETVAKCKG